MAIHQEPSEPTMSEQQETQQDDTRVNIPPGARTSETELPEGIAIPILEYNQLTKKPPLSTIDFNSDDPAVNMEEQDYVDHTLFSPEVSRHSIEVAVRRAKTLEQELRDMSQDDLSTKKAALAGSVTTNMPSTLLNAVKRIVGARNRYSLLDEKQASADSQMVGESDNTDGDGMQLSPVSSNDEVFKARPSTPSVLRKISAYGNDHAGTMPTPKPKKRINWKESEDDGNESKETNSLVPDNNHEVKITIAEEDQPTNRPPKRKAKSGVIRRLTPKEKEELYELRPDLKIIPNWAQKYREEMIVSIANGGHQEPIAMLRYLTKQTMQSIFKPNKMSLCVASRNLSARFTSTSNISNEFADHPILNSCGFDFPFDGAEYNASTGKHKYGRRVADWTMKRVNQTMGENNRIDYENLTQLITLLTARNYYNEAIELLQFARIHGAKPPISAYSQVIASCYSQQQYDDALQVFDVMRRDGFQPSFVTYSRALSAATKGDYHDLTLELFEDLIQDCQNMSYDSIGIACNIVLHSCGKHCDFKTASEIWQQMTDEGIPKNNSTYTAYLLAALGAKVWDEFNSVLDESFASGIVLFAPSYFSMIQTCAKHKQWDLVIHIHQKLLGHQLELTGMPPGAVMMAYCKQGDPTMTIKMYNDSMKAGTRLNAYSISAVITAHLHLRDFKKGMEICDKAVEDFPDAGMLYKLKVQLLFALNNIEEGVELLDAKKHLMDKTANCYRPLIAHYLSKRMYDEAARYSLIMFEGNRFVASSDWTNALSAAIALPDKSTYWVFRNWIESRALDLVPLIPDELMLERLPRENVPQKQPKLLSPRRPLKLL
ncbi:hypothetical protein THRCLA_06746 [Thraustotheca clavata]|uniref:Pentacotripeptide-repeat region of PRORP domain-containing protein n=1 Tax=Thraustotheca clavata TaxID=74557 RepID=A0A1V9ZK37_9STRA|nr:hypothetical protein THRCLA_06746 [Thraustotheca clavata]